ncbi:hypothetical protein JXA40_11185 [bacterium]|nr:hypothetical protein [candidate division CSSED10-310 bacterium]
MKSSKLLLSIMVCTFLAYAVPISTAGIFDVTLGLDLYGTYDDNLLLQSQEQIDAGSEDPHDRILQVRPFFSILHEAKRSFIRIKGTFFREWYDVHHNLERTDRSYTNFSLLASWDITDRLTLSLDDDFTDSLYGLEREEIPEIREDYITNHFKPKLSFNMEDKLVLALGMQWSFLDYDRPPVHYGPSLSGYEDWEHLALKLNGHLMLLSETNLILGGEIWIRDYEDECSDCDSDGDGYNLQLGIEQKFNREMTIKGWLNYDHRRYDKLALGAEDRIHNNFGGFIEFIDQFSGLMRWRVTGFSTFIPSERFSNSFYRNTGIETEFNANTLHRLESSVMVHYARVDYKHVADEWQDDYLKLGLTLGYRVTEWLSLRGRYQFSERESERDEYDFKDNLFSVYLHFTFNFYR